MPSPLLTPHCNVGDEIGGIAQIKDSGVDNMNGRTEVYGIQDIVVRWIVCGMKSGVQHIGNLYKLREIHASSK